jgi:two-component system, cell cycle response regulator DivK
MARQDIDRRRTPRPQVLVVAEDTDSLRELWKVWLGSLGFEVIAASTGAQAVALATTYRPVAIIMDLAMPVMDGLEATRRLKQDARTADLPVVMVTAYNSDPYRRAAEDAGCAAFLPKPADPEALLAELRRVLGSA